MSTKKVFVVHGRNENIRKATFEFLRALGLNPQEWGQLLKQSTRNTREASPYIGNVITEGLRNAAIVVLLTGDDLARLSDEFIKANDPEYETKQTRQPRQNVLLEAGMALGAYPEKTVMIQIGNIRKISDLDGRHICYMDNSSEKRQELATKLKAAGCNINTSGKDWLTAGDFASVESPGDVEREKDVKPFDGDFPVVIKILQKMQLSDTSFGKGDDGQPATQSYLTTFQSGLRNLLCIGFKYDGDNSIRKSAFFYICPVLMTHGLVRFEARSRESSACYWMTERGIRFTRYLDVQMVNDEEKRLHTSPKQVKPKTIPKDASN